MENQQLLELIGETKTQKLLDNVTTEFQEKFQKQIDYKEILKAMSIVTITKDKEIKSIGMSCINDILSDNFATFLGQLIGQSGLNRMNDVSNVNYGVPVWAGNNTFNRNSEQATGTLIKIGTGTSQATRQDFNIENEKMAVNTGVGGWNSGLGKTDIASSVVSNFADSISETAIFAKWWQNLGGQSPVRTFLLSRDNISPVVSVIIGETINIDYALIWS